MLRSIIFLTYLFLAALVIGIVAFPALLKREWSLAVSKVWAGSSLFVLRTVCGVRDEVEGAENIPEGAAIIAAKHQSMWETLKLTVLLPRPSFVLKKELSHWPIFSWFCKANGFIFIDRDAGASSLRDMTNQARAMASEGAQIIIFPEGTRAKPGEDVPFQPGVAALAKALKVPTVPVGHNSGEHWVNPGPMKNPGTIHLKFHPAIHEVGKRDRYLADLKTVIDGIRETA